MEEEINLIKDSISSSSVIYGATRNVQLLYSAERWLIMRIKTYKGLFWECVIIFVVLNETGVRTKSCTISGCFTGSFWKDVLQSIFQAESE